VAMDGRTIVHCDQRIQRSFDTWEGQPGWDADPELAGARLVIAQTRTPLVSLPRPDPRFQLVYEDTSCSSWQKTSGACGPPSGNSWPGRSLQLQNLGVAILSPWMAPAIAAVPSSRSEPEELLAPGLKRNAPAAKPLGGAASIER
jgi:hypothetical protein